MKNTNIINFDQSLSYHQHSHMQLSKIIRKDRLNEEDIAVIEKVIKNIIDNLNEILYISIAYYDLLCLAAQNGHLEAVKRLAKLTIHQNEIHNFMDSQALQLAAQHGHLLVVKYLAELTDSQGNRICNSSQALRLAAQNGHLLVVKHLVKADNQHKSSYSANAYYDAICGATKNGHNQLVCYLYDTLKEKIHG